MAYKNDKKKTSLKIRKKTERWSWTLELFSKNKFQGCTWFQPASLVGTKWWKRASDSAIFDNCFLKHLKDKALGVCLYTSSHQSDLHQNLLHIFALSKHVWIPFQKKHITKDLSNPGSIGASHEKGRSTTLQHFLQHPSNHLITQSTTQRHNLQRISTNLNHTCFLAKLATNWNLLPPKCSMTTGFFSRPPPQKKQQVFQNHGFDWLKGTWYFMMLALEPPPWRANTSQQKKKRGEIQKAWTFRNHGKMVVHHILNI